MNVKSKVIEDIKLVFIKEIQTAEGIIRGNRYAMKKLVEEQTVLKRKKVELYKILNIFYKKDL